MWSPSLSVKDSRRVGWRDAGSARVGTRSRQRECERDRCGEGEASTPTCLRLFFFPPVQPRDRACMCSHPTRPHAHAFQPPERERDKETEAGFGGGFFSGQGVVVLI